MTTPTPDRYADQWADVIDAEVWAAVRRLSRIGADAWRVAAFFTRAREGGR